MELSLTLFFIAALAVIPFSVVSQDSPDDYVAAHNAARQAVGVGHITWNEKVAEYAKNYAAKRVGDCQLTHSGGAYGENIAWGSGDLSGARAVKLWVDEKPYYDYASNSCTQGKACGHYTQVVWRDSVQLGCAKVKCTNGRGTFIICSYNPPGNIVGQRPY